MIATTTQPNTELTKGIGAMLKAFEEGTKQAYQILWQTLISFLTQRWLVITLALAVILLIAIVKAIMGYWGMLGSLIYHYLYFGILLVVGLIWGSNIFVSDFFHLACTIILYPVCYYIVDIILDKTGLYRKR